MNYVLCHSDLLVKFYLAGVQGFTCDSVYLLKEIIGDAQRGFLLVHRIRRER